MAGRRGRRGRRASSGDELRGRRAEALSQRTERRPGGSRGVRPPSGVPAPCGSRTGLGTRPRFWGPGPSLLLQHFRSACLAGRAEAGKGTWSGEREKRPVKRSGRLSLQSSRDGGVPTRSPQRTETALFPGLVFGGSQGMRVVEDPGWEGLSPGVAGDSGVLRKETAEKCSRENSFSGGMLCRFKRGV